MPPSRVRSRSRSRQGSRKAKVISRGPVLFGSAKNLSAATKAVSRGPSRPAALRSVLASAHQFGLVERGGKFYDDRPERLKQIFERLSGKILLIAPQKSLRSASRAASEALRRCQHAADVQLEILTAEKASDGAACGFHCLIFYEIPNTEKEYVRHLISPTRGRNAASSLPELVYTMIEERDMTGKACSALAPLFKEATDLAKRTGDVGKATQLITTVNSLCGEPEDEADGELATPDAEEDEDDEDDEDDDDVPRISELFVGQCSVAYHAAKPLAPASAPIAVEFVRVPLRALKNLSAIGPMMQPRLAHACTIIACHNLNCFDPWDRYEHLFALPKGAGAVRVVQVLADNGDWHDYPDLGCYAQGGVVSLDILDADSMLATDQLLEGLVEHETKLLRGKSERIVLFGKSAGGIQAMLRFLRSRRRLGAFIGGMCHVPTAPHVPRSMDSLAAVSGLGSKRRVLPNATQPVRLLAGEADTIFPPTMVLRDAQHLREVGGFTDVKVEVGQGLTHDDDVLDENGCFVDPAFKPAELLFLSRHLHSVLPRGLGKAVKQ